MQIHRSSNTHADNLLIIGHYHYESIFGPRHADPSELQVRFVTVVYQPAKSR